MTARDSDDHRSASRELTRELSPLEALVAAAVATEAQAAAYDDPRLAEWLLSETRARMTLPEVRENERVAARIARRMRLRLAAERTRESLPVHGLTSRAAPPGGNLAASVVDAARAGYAPWIETSQVAAGTGRELWDEPCERWVELPRGRRGGHHVAVSVHGDSMVPVLLPHDVIVVRLGMPGRVGQIVVARVPEGGHVVKRVAAVGRRTIELESFNPGYSPFRIPSDPCLVLGVVTDVLR